MATNKPGKARKPTKKTPPTAAIALPVDPATPSDGQVDRVIEFILRGDRQHSIEREIIREFPGADPKSYLAAALQRAADASKASPEAIRGLAYLWCQELYAKMYATGDFAGALRAVKLLHDLAMK